ncbi:hypothetical protein SKP52_15400 [Sphingopyxis fribergensis]|uniref:Uncharacterized protein n=1 Tax=Sphingopyxis fribergensis TaxID=1515612 RepID=A0A0A7PIZ8_9SPHN|nr:hypothetical protein [Sphingopyxis fribergensis]AJA09959.1 hypothetical protein SKP52_15400 [Sphingopyxis fribergensis]
MCFHAHTAGNDSHVCSSGTSLGGLPDTGGNNQLTLPTGGTGVIAGNVTFGGGNDVVVIDSGRINGGVDQGNGDDRFQISAGTVTGQVQQGEGIDDGDTARMSDGRIGRVDMKLADNLFAYEYFLFRGGTTTGTAENWYLRSTLPPPPPENPPPLQPGPAPRRRP